MPINLCIQSLIVQFKHLSSIKKAFIYFPVSYSVPLWAPTQQRSHPPGLSHNSGISWHLFHKDFTLNSSAQHYLRASSVLLFSEGLLGSPIPIRLAATTRNSYSTQGFSPTTVAVNVLPSMISGTGDARKPTGILKTAGKQAQGNLISLKVRA